MDLKKVKEEIESAGVKLYWKEDLEAAHHSKAYKIVMKISELQGCPNKNAFIQLREWKKLGDEMIAYIEAVSRYLEVSSSHWDRLVTDSSEKKYRRWTKEEDEMLIELVCSGVSQAELSSSMGRTIPAIKTRVSKLVGDKRISKKVAGLFLGTFNGQYVEGTVNGEVRMGKSN